MAEIVVKRFRKADEDLWNDFVATAKNATFLFHRRYMNYHADRFLDHSLLLYHKGKLKALFVAHESESSIVSHGGLSYGGLILEREVKLEEVLNYFFYLLNYYHKHQFTTVVYKCLPSYYAHYPSQEDLYAMFLLKASLIHRDTSSVFSSSMQLPYQQMRRRNIKKGQLARYRIVAASDPKTFWNEVLIPNLKTRFDSAPVHTLKEIKKLMKLFPKNIQLYEVHSNEILGGILMYVTDQVAHCQYISATPEGKAGKALDFLVHKLLQEIYNDKRFFCFGTSNGEEEHHINTGLVKWKEGFGARTFAFDCYQIETVNYNLLSRYAY
jgi:hypothetical protein